MMRTFLVIRKVRCFSLGKGKKSLWGLGFWSLHVGRSFFLGILGKENTEMWNVRDRNYLRLCLAASKEKTLNNSSLHKIEDCSSITLKSPNVGSSSPSWKFKDLGSFSCAISLSVLFHGLKQVFHFQPNHLYDCPHKGGGNTKGLPTLFKEISQELYPTFVLSHMATPGKHLILFQVSSPIRSSTSNEEEENAQWEGRVAAIPQRKEREF